MNRDNMYANQRSVCVNRDDADEANVYSKQRISTLETARKILSGNGFKLWTYFAQNADGYEFALYSKHVIDKCRFGENTYTKVFKELVNLGFLVQSEDNHKHYDFYESPRAEKIDITIHKMVDDLTDYIDGDVIPCN